MLKVILTLFGFLALSVNGQMFRNLQMEEVTTNSISFGPDMPGLPSPSGVGLVSDLLPGWQLFFNDEPRSEIGFNLSEIGAARATVFESRERC